VTERGDTDGDRIPQRRRTGGLELRPEDRQQLAAVSRELARIELNAGREAADACLVLRTKRLDELPRRHLDEPEVRLHAATAIEEHDHGDRLHRAFEHRDRLASPVVVNLELLTREIRHEAAARVLHGRVNRHGARTGPEGLDGLSARDGRQRAERDDPQTRNSSSLVAHS
jgi:hypothetical protein